jgi:arylsulfatase A-like enzyme
MWSQRLQREGYHTGYFGKWHVERSARLERFGFAEYEVLGTGASDPSKFIAHRRRLGLPPTPRDYVDRYEVKQAGYRDYMLYGVLDEPEEGSAFYYTFAQGIDFLQRAAQRDQPWCLFVSSSGPGDPHHVPRAYADRYDPDEIAEPASFCDDLAERPTVYRRQREVWEDVDWPDHAKAIACYYARCTLMDAQIGRLLAALEETGQADNTVVVYTNDHGIMMGAHGLHCLGVFPFEEGYRIPLIVRWPGVTPSGSTCEALVNTLDLTPTLCEMANAGTLEAAEGRSLTPWLRGETPTDWPDDCFAEFHGQRFFWTQRIVWADRYKYVFNGFDRDELYDLEDDPYEMTNLAVDPANTDLVEAMATRMWTHIRAIDDHNMLGSHYGSLRVAPVGPLVTGGDEGLEPDI